jgi:periplasmic protein TonB
MEFRTKKKIFFQEAFILSSVVHIGAICFLAFWYSNNTNYTQETKPIQIKTIIYEPPVKSRLEKSNPIQAMPEPVQPVLKHSVPLPVKKPRSIFPLGIESVRPVNIQKGMNINQFVHPKKSIRSVSVAKLGSVLSPSFSVAGQARQFKNIVKQHSIQPVLIPKAVGSVGRPSSEIMVTRVSREFYITAVADSLISARKVSDNRQLAIAFGEPTQEINSKIITAPSNRIHPVHVSSIPAGFVEGARDEQLVTRKHLEGAVDLSSKDIEGVRRAFSSGIWRKIAKSKYYPQTARRQGWEGKPVIEFQIGRDGILLSHSVVVPSPYEILDQAALAAVKNAGPFPEIPKSLKLNAIKFKLPISFKLD